MKELSFYERLGIDYTELKEIPMKIRLKIYHKIMGETLFAKVTPDGRSLFEIWCEDNAEIETIRQKYSYAVIGHV